ncbi:Protein CBG17465 [Caenorhabditis briggsae]|uniref:Protein CBG17465 n=1 Tax=Caenorhabditis briggsae TaxID=6238 RepID=A8XR49_CAEBR|nr:Protein CBG17465 [Caenorhabditis briggsae]CAP35122.1 Protein CBG17465 [Caenorhabditis briggsae]
MTAASPHRTLIVDFYKRGLSTGDISKRLGVHRNTVFATIRRFNQLGHLKDRTGRGRPRTVRTPAKVKAVREKVRRNARRSMKKMSDDMDISYTSMRRIVRKELKMTSYRATKAAILSQANKEKRLIKAKRLLAGTRKKDRLITIFSDEKLFRVEAEFNSQNHRVLATNIQQAAERGKTIHRASHPASIMVFGAACYDGKRFWRSMCYRGLKTTSVRRNTSSNKMERLLIPQKWLNSGARTTYPAFIPKDKWPAYSPDLNPLDYFVWGDLPNKVCARPNANIEALKKSLSEEWDKLSVEYLRATIDAFPRRLRAVVAAKGGRIE